MENLIKRKKKMGHEDDVWKIFFFLIPETEMKEIQKHKGKSMLLLKLAASLFCLMAPGRSLRWKLKSRKVMK